MICNWRENGSTTMLHLRSSVAALLRRYYCLVTLPVALMLPWIYMLEVSRISHPPTYSCSEWQRSHCFPASRWSYIYECAILVWLHTTCKKQDIARILWLERRVCVGCKDDTWSPLITERWCDSSHSRYHHSDFSSIHYPQTRPYCEFNSWITSKDLLLILRKWLDQDSNVHRNSRMGSVSDSAQCYLRVL